MFASTHFLLNGLLATCSSTCSPTVVDFEHDELLLPHGSLCQGLKLGQPIHDLSLVSYKSHAWIPRYCSTVQVSMKSRTTDGGGKQDGWFFIERVIGLVCDSMGSLVK
ncbi:hypothetical protein AAC387_Pa04g2995 [Persea americana]